MTYVISIHALLAESDGIGLVFLWWGVRFLSTLSLRRATCYSLRHSASVWHFYPRSPCGERRRPLRNGHHPPNFYPRSPCGERRQHTHLPRILPRISIHALLAESDKHDMKMRMIRTDFYPRSPCGERRITTIITCTASKFLSTLSLRRATRGGVACYLDNIISIHALLAESDGHMFATLSVHLRFLSTLSLRRATGLHCEPETVKDISIHALLAESDLTIMLYDPSSLIFLSTLSLRRATSLRQLQSALYRNFYPRSPCGERQPATRRNNQHNVFLSTLSLRRATT